MASPNTKLVKCYSHMYVYISGHSDMWVAGLLALLLWCS